MRLTRNSSESRVCRIAPRLLIRARPAIVRPPSLFFPSSFFPPPRLTRPTIRLNAAQVESRLAIAVQTGVPGGVAITLVNRALRTSPLVRAVLVNPSQVVETRVRGGVIVFTSLARRAGAHRRQSEDRVGSESFVFVSAR